MTKIILFFFFYEEYPDCGNVLQQIPAFLNITEHDKGSLKRNINFVSVSIIILKDVQLQIRTNNAIHKSGFSHYKHLQLQCERVYRMTRWIDMYKYPKMYSGI